MKAIALFLLLPSVGCGFRQTDTNVIAVGAWSEPVSDSDGRTLRGRLLVYDEQSAPNHARIYLELQHVFKSAWSNPLEIYFDIGLSNDLHFEMRDQLDQPVPRFPVRIRGPAPSPCWVTLSCDSTVRLRADTYTLGPPSKPDGLEILVRGGCWLIGPNATNDFFLSGSFTPSTDHPSPLQYHVWRGTLKLPKVKVSLTKPLLRRPIGSPG
jgi:hypothetical protein